MKKEWAQSAGQVRSGRALPLAMLVGQGTIFGAMFSINKIATTSGIPFVGYAFWQSFGAGASLMVAAIILGRVPPVTASHLRM